MNLHRSMPLSLILLYLTVNGSWSSWTSWSQCSHTCGNGTRRRDRECNNPEPKFGGLDCVGRRDDLEGCYEKICPGLYVQCLLLSSCVSLRHSIFNEEHV